VTLAEGAPARLAAARLVCGVLKSKRTLDDTLATEPAFKALAGADRAFARAMASAALRHLGRIDAVLLPLVDRPRGRLGEEVKALLRIGAAQMWLLDTPHHAAVAETVAAAKLWPDTLRASGLVNAVLRKAGRGADRFNLEPASATWPAWLRADLRRSIGEEAAEDLASAQLDVPELHLTVRCKADAGAVAETLGGRVILPGTVALPPGPVDRLSGYEDGTWWVQDAAAALAARILAPGPEERVFDLCAAPGGKTLQLAASGASVVAVDRSKPRLRRLEENLDRTGLGARVAVVAANLEAWQPSERADAILLDAPCSALGTLRRHPEGAWIKSREDIARFPEVQARLLAAAADWTAPGGRLVYCVCTPRAEEGRDVIDAACASGLWRRDPVMPDEAHGFATALTPAGDLLTLPASGGNTFGHDAFFVSRLRRA